MSADYELFKGTSLSDLFKKINHNSDRNKIQIESLIQELMTFIKDPNSAIQLFPMISDYMEANIRNDELLVKLAAVVQRVIQTEFKTTEGEYGLSDAEKEQIINKLEDATRDLQKEVDDLNFEIK